MMNIRKALAKKNRFKQLFGTDLGKEVLGDLYKSYVCTKNSFNPNNQYMSAYNEGKRAVVLEIMEILQMNDVALFKMLENIQEEE